MLLFTVVATNVARNAAAGFEVFVCPQVTPAQKPLDTVL
jgi:hypothetical protein